MRWLHRYRHQLRALIRVFKLTNPKSFIFLMSIVVGIFGGLSAVILKNLVHFTGQIVYSERVSSLNYLSVLLPGVGIFLTVLFTRKVIQDNISHGVAKVLSAISKDRGQIKQHNTYSSVVASSLTVGFGGSVGLEAPIVYTGAALGSNMAEKLSLNYKMRVLFIACGCAAAISGIFKAPIAGTIFALEVLMIDLTLWSIIPLLLSSVAAATVSYLLMGESASFSFAIFEKFQMIEIPLYLLLGVLCGLFAILFTSQSRWVEKRFNLINNWIKRVVVGGIILGILILFFPPLFGEGYLTLKNLLSGTPENILINSLFSNYNADSWMFLFFLLLVLIFKIYASSLTSAAGGIGGVFAPALFSGGLLGFIFSKTLNQFDWWKLSDSNYSLVGMAGVMSAIMHAPLTSVFLIAEITGGYALFLPLIITSSVSFLVKSNYDKHSIYTHKLAMENALVTHNKDKTAMGLIDTKELIENDFTSIAPDDDLGTLVKKISVSKRNVFPVIKLDGELLGLVNLDDVREAMFKPELYTKRKVADYMSKPVQTIDVNDKAETILHKFELSNVWNLPVTDNKIYIGMISKSDILQEYRKLLVTISED